MGRTRLTLALAGHPPPALVSAAGEVSLVGEHGTLLGVLDPIEVGLTRIEMEPGDTLLLYTDGLPDAGLAGAQLGEDAMIELFHDAPRASLEGMLEHIERAALVHAEGGLRDDLALLALRVSHG